MGKEYSAFISYRHAPADIAAASEIQKRLERYPVPAAIRKKTGKAKIGRIFRDKEELPITSDLNEDITEALENADYLIVICSTSTKESMWVEREIRTFLKNHSKKEILTVLVNGEPYEVIPEILLTNTVERTAPDGTVFEETINYEPLSCDFRTGMKSARRTEIPRLAAALLGCKYDELVMRERQYKRRRLTAILAATGTLAAIALTYLIWSRAEIKKNYDLAQYNYELSEKNYQLAQDNYEEAQRNYGQALLNQSEYLSSESRDLLDDGDRLRAIELAMEALPSEKNDRPLSPKAEEALIVALNAYLPPETPDHKNAMTQIAEYRADGSIIRMDATENNKYLLALDSYGTVYVWDIDSAELAYEIRSVGTENEPVVNPADPENTEAEQESGAIGALNQMKAILEEHGDELDPEDRNKLEDSIRALTDATENLAEAAESAAGIVDKTPDLNQLGVKSAYGGIQEYLLLSDETIAVKTFSGVYAYNFLTGEELWHYRNKEIYWYNARLDASQIGKIVFIVWNTHTAASETEAGSSILHAAALNAETGELLNEGSIATGWEEAVYIHGSAVAKGGPILAFEAGPDRVDLSYRNIYLYRKEDGSIQEIPAGERFAGIHEMAFYDDTHLAVAGYPDYTEYSGGGSVTVRDLMTEIQDFKINVFCINAETGEIISDGTFTSPQINNVPEGSGFAFINKENADVKIACMYANKIAVFSPESGEKLDEVEFTGSIVRGGTTGKEKVVCYLDNGGIGVYDPGEKGISRESPYFTFDNYGMLSVKRSEEDTTVRFLVRTDANTVRLYDTVYDQEFVRFENATLPKDLSVVGNDIADDHLVLLDRNSNLYLLKLDGTEPLRIIDLPGDTNKYDYIGKDDEKGVIWLKDKTESENDLICISVNDGAITPVSLTGGAYATFRMQRDGRLSYMSRKTVTLLDTADTEKPEPVFTVQVGEVNQRFFVNPSGSTIVVSKENASSKSGYRVLTVDAETEKQTELDIAAQDIIRLADWDAAEDRMALTDGYSVFLLDGEGTPITKLNEAGENVVNFTFFEDNLVVLYSGGHLTRYSSETGIVRGRSVIRHYTTEPFIEKTRWTFSENTLYLTREDTVRTILSFIDLSTWEESGSTQYMYGYDASRDRIICYGKDPETEERHLGYFRHYTIEDLLRKGKEALRDFSMTNEERLAYGLS
ncbi:MAG: TIR domain-containing protein [Lachnospiraceae bacterium]|nr:TIR domain-containing protein [Lachnospiraceae bacterium]